MTVNESLLRAEMICGADVEQEIKINALNQVEGRIVKEVFSRYPDLSVNNFEKYRYDSDGSKVLMVDEPYDELYVHFIAAQIYLYLHEQRLYNNHMTIFNQIYYDYKIYLNRNYRPGGVKRYGLQ